MVSQTLSRSVSMSCHFPSLRKSAVVRSDLHHQVSRAAIWSAFTHLLKEIDRYPGRPVNSTYSIKASKVPYESYPHGTPSLRKLFENLWGTTINAITMQCLYAGTPPISLVPLFTSLSGLRYFISSSAVDSLPPGQPVPHPHCLPGSCRHDVLENMSEFPVSTIVPTCRLHVGSPVAPAPD